MLKTLVQYFQRLREYVKRDKLKVVHEADLKDLLSSIGILELVENGEIECNVCKCIINLDNLSIIKNLQGKIVIVCNKNNCQC